MSDFRLYDKMQQGNEFLSEPQCEPIGVIDHQPKLFEQVSFGDKTYVIGIISRHDGWCIGDEIVDFDGDTEYEREMICPWCGHVQSDPWELRDDDGEHDCGTCNREFKYVRQYDITYSTARSERARKEADES